MDRSDNKTYKKIVKKFENTISCIIKLMSNDKIGVDLMFARKKLGTIEYELIEMEEQLFGEKNSSSLSMRREHKYFKNNIL